LHQARADAGTGYELAAITAVVLGGSSIFGGKGNVPGTLLGIAAIALLNNGIGRIPAVFKLGIGNELANLLTGVLLLVALAAGNLHRLTSFPFKKRSHTPH
jgi:rhamnose transport system permease protein